MKLNDYRQMMAYMRRPGFQNGTMVPPQKPEQKTPFIDKLKNLKEVSPFLMPRSKVSILKMYMDEALKDGEITQEQHTEMLMPYFGELGENVTEQIAVSDRDNFAIGGGIIKGQELPNNREGFAYSIKQVNEKRIKASQSAGEGIDISSLTPEQKKLYDEGKLFYTRVKESGKVDKYKNVFGTENYLNFITGKIDMKDLPDDLSNLPTEIKNTGKLAQLIKKKFISDYLSTLPKGTTILLDDTARVINEKLMEATNGRIRIPDKQQLRLILDDKKLNTNNIKAPKDLKEAKSLMLADQYPDKKELPKIQKIADDLNKEYKLDNKGISFKANTSDKTGRVFLELNFSSPSIREEFNKAPRLTAAPTKEGIEKLTSELDNVVNTNFFKNYDSKVGQGSGMTLETALKKVKYNQPELFEYLLNKKGPISEKEVMDEIGYNKGTLRKAVGSLHENIYRALDANQPGAGRFLSDQYNPDQIKNVLDKVKNNFDVDYYRRTFEKLLIDAYGKDAEKYKPLADKLEKFRDLQKELKKAGVGEEFIAQLDHVIPYNFLQLIRKGSNPEDLIRVRAYPGVLNNNMFKGTLDRKLGEATKIFQETGDRKLLDTMNELRSFLPEDMGQVSSGGKKVIDYSAEPFNLKTIYSDQQKKFGEVYKRTQEFLENPKVINLLKDAGISFRALSQLKKLNVPGFLNTFKELKKSRPELFVGIDDEFADIENQYAALDTGTMSDVSPVKKETEEPGLPAEAIGAGTLFGMKYAPQIARGVGTAIKAVGSPLTGLTLAATELASDDPSLGQAGAEIVFTDQIKRVAGQVPKGIMSNVFGLQGLSKFGKLGTALATRIPRAMTPVGLTLLGAEGIKKLYDEEQKKNRMIEAMDPEERLQFLEEEKATEELMSRASAAYGGRMGFADGPEDPKKRKFMKIMGGLASIPLLGRFIDIGTSAPKVAEVLRRGADGMPDFIYDLIAKVKAKAEATGMKYFTGNRADEFADVYQADNYVVTEKGNKITIREVDQDGDMLYKENQMEIDLDPETGGVTYNEASAKPDMEGKLKDVEEYIETDDLENMRKYTYDE